MSNSASPPAKLGVYLFINHCGPIMVVAIVFINAKSVNKKFVFVSGFFYLLNMRISQIKLSNKTSFKHLVSSYLKGLDRKSTRLNSSHSQISYAVFCLK